MNEASLISNKRVQGEVRHNDGFFAVIQTVGIEGIEENLLLETIQVHVEDFDLSCEQFLERFPVGTWLDIRTTVAVAKMDTGGLDTSVADFTAS
jgi:hypothetical protein